MPAVERDSGQASPSFEREAAKRVFAAELREVRVQFKEGEDRKSPGFILFPTGERANRIFIVGTLTEKERRGEQNLYYQARVADPTGTFYIMAGSYQPDAMQQMAMIEPPSFVAVIGKPTLFEGQSGATRVSVRAESISVVDAETRNIWILDTARSTLKRIESFGNTEDSKRAREQYNTDLQIYRKMVYDALAQMKI
ncbi:MAG: nucleic acid-binding protein [Methanomicrobiales archaeon]|nr:nucleic acid-binding protein [Methanomicrobiales archaeon]